MDLTKVLLTKKPLNEANTPSRYGLSNVTINNINKQNNIPEVHYDDEENVNNQNNIQPTEQEIPQEQPQQAPTDQNVESPQPQQSVQSDDDMMKDILNGEDSTVDTQEVPEDQAPSNEPQSDDDMMQDILNGEDNSGMSDQSQEVPADGAQVDPTAQTQNVVTPEEQMGNYTNPGANDPYSDPNALDADMEDDPTSLATEGEYTDEDMAGTGDITEDELNAEAEEPGSLKILSTLSDKEYKLCNLKLFTQFEDLRKKVSDVLSGDIGNISTGNRRYQQVIGIVSDNLSAMIIDIDRYLTMNFSDIYENNLVAYAKFSKRFSYAIKLIHVVRKKIIMEKNED